MKRALRLAVLGKFDAFPNPLVGAVIVKDNKIIGQGYHKTYGEAHAEVNAYNNALENNKSIEGATLYVSLEPCSHQGKTPSCADFLINKKIKKVFVAMIDPNPLVSGQGIQKLKSAGIEVEVGLLAEEAKKINTAFIKKQTISIPLVKAKLGMSFDGKYALNNGKSKWITGELARSDVQRERATVGAIITGANTVIADNPKLNVRTKLKYKNIIRQPLKVIFDTNLETSLSSDIFKTEQILIVHNSTKEPENNWNVSYLKESNLKNVLSYLSEKFNITSVLIESGGTLLSSFLKDKLIDELIIYQAPIILGSNKNIFSFEITDLTESITLNHQNIVFLGKDLKFTSLVVYP